MILSKKILDFLLHLQTPADLPEAVEVMNPFSDPETTKAVTTFYKKYYHDNQSRYCIIGINPGRFGAGITGVPFTDPIRLKDVCGIDNNWSRKQELSSLFVYDVIEAFGGPQKFYGSFYITAVSPLGFTRHGKNLNYYDDKGLQQAIKPFVIDCIKQQLSWGLKRNVAFCLGEGTNFKIVQKLNDEQGFFEKIVPLSHPRFVMQYKLKQKQVYINKYLEAFSECE